MSETIRVGDVVAWADVPDGALVRVAFNASPGIIEGHLWYALRLAGQGAWVGAPRDWHRFCSSWPWDEGTTNSRVTIIALGLTGEEMADDLRRLAEVFEVREALAKMPERWALRHFLRRPGWAPGTPRQEDAALAERLHAAGWRKGQTAKEAADLLAAQEAPR